MRRLEVSDTTFHGTFVEGGWKTTVPTISVARSDERFQDIVASLRRVGATPAKAEEVAIESVQGLFDGAWIGLIKKFVGRAAKLYEESYGDLGGFDPEEIEGLFLPARDDLFGQRKNHEVRTKFTSMRRAWEASDGS